MLHDLLRLAGRYRGAGAGGSGGGGSSELSLVPVVDGAGLLLRFTIRREDGTRLHDEYTLIAPAESGGLVLCHLDDAHRACLAYALDSVRRASGRTVYEFAPLSASTESPRIVLGIEGRGAISYAFGGSATGSIHLARVD